MINWKEEVLSCCCFYCCVQFSVGGLANYRVHSSATLMTKLLHHFLYMLDFHTGSPKGEKELYFGFLLLASRWLN